MTRNETRATAANYWRDRAHDALASARLELDAGRLHFAVNRAYFSCYYAASAALLREGHRFVKRTGVRVAFNREFVMTGRIPAGSGAFYDCLFSARQRADCEELVTLETEAVRETVVQAEDFVRELESLS